jgi:raffinose/stachyose/melibiose transport system substrate-binding protein
LVVRHVKIAFLMLLAGLFLVMPGFGQSTNKVKLEVWAPVPTSLQWPKVYAAFEKKYPNIEIEYWRGETSDYMLKLQVAMAADEGPDSLWLNGSMLSKYASFLDPLSDNAAKSWGANWKNDLASVKYLDDISVKDKVVSMPFLVAGQPFVLYNKTIFDQYGLKPPKNFDEWKKVCDTLKAHGIIPVAIGLKDGWINTDMFLAMANQYAPGKVYDAIEGKLSFTDKPFVDALTAWKKLIDAGIFENGALGVSQYPNARDQYFYDRKAAMFITGSWHLGYALPEGEKNQGTKIQKDDTGAFLLPQIGPNPTRVFASIDGGFGISSGSKNKDAAWKFVEFIARGDGEQVMLDYLQGFSPWKGMGAKSLDELKPSDREAIGMAQKAFDSPVGPRSVKYPEIDTAIGVAMQELATGGKSAQTVAKDIQTVSESAKR